MEFFKDNWELILSVLGFIVANASKMLIQLRAVHKGWQKITSPDSPGGVKITDAEQAYFNPLMQEAIKSITAWYNVIIGVFNVKSYETTAAVKNAAKTIRDSYKA